MKPLDQARQLLAKEAVGRANRIAERYARIFPEHRADFESSANWGIIRAAASYNEEKGEVWSRWSELCIRGEIKDFLDCAYLKHRKLAPDSEIETLFAGGRSRIRNRTSNLDDFESEESLNHILGKLPPRHRELCDLVYRDNMSPYSAGQALGMTGESGCRLHREAIGILREALAA